MKIYKKVCECLLLVLVILCIGIFGVWHNELSSIASIHKLVDAKEDNQSGPVYLMDVSGGYYFDEFLENGGASNDAELIQFVVDHITKGIIPISIAPPSIGCSSFTSTDQDGNRYFARNYDMSTTSSMIVRTNPKDGRYASISSVDLKFLGIKDGAEIDGLMKKFIALAAPYAPLDGINEAGVSCGIYMSYQGTKDNVVATNQQTEKPDLTSSTMLRMILDYASSVDEAIALVKKYDLHDSARTSFHYMVADSTGSSAILEWVNGTDETDIDGSKRTLHVYRNDADSEVGEKEGNETFQYVTNFIVTPGYYDADEDKGGLDRYQVIQNTIDPDGSNPQGMLEEKDAMNLLETVGRRKWDANNGKSDKNHITVWSALYNLTKKSVTWVSNEEYDDSSSVFTFDFGYTK